jgi:hypothetical protein
VGLSDLSPSKKTPPPSYRGGAAQSIQEQNFMLSIPNQSKTYPQNALLPVCCLPELLLSNG